ncbi:MAG: hypothetical protein IT236_13235 [Bacteroidia bacterium]|nr:hypothetical protein [Bacteroidia bacterium]
MKKFLLENWSKLMINSSIMMTSFGFMIYTISSASAGNASFNSSDNQRNNNVVPINPDGTISVKIIDEQFEKLTRTSVKPVNVNIQELAGRPVCYSYSKDCSILEVSHGN